MYHVFAPARDEKVNGDKNKVPRITSCAFQVRYREIGELGPCGVGWFRIHWDEGQEDDKPSKGPRSQWPQEAGGPPSLVNARARFIPILA